MTHIVTDDLTTLHVPFTKALAAEDGTLVVYGKITGDDLDLDRQKVKREWARTAVPEWHERAGNIREMHQPKAIGKSISWEELDDGFYVRAEIIDRDAQNKVAKGILSGFSIGVKDGHISMDASAPRGIIDGGRIVEVSMVDAPANPTAKVKEFLWKAVDTDDLLTKLATGETTDDAPAADADLLAKSGTEPPKTPPKGYPEDKDQYADPETYGFPIDTPARTRSAMAYYNAGKGKAGREDRWEAIGRKIAAKAGHFFGGTYHLEGGDIVGGKDDKSLLRDTLIGEAVILLDASGRAIIPNVREVEKDAGGAATDYPAGASIDAADDYAPFPLELRDAFHAVLPEERSGGTPGNQDGDDLVPPQFRAPRAPVTLNPNSAAAKDAVDLGPEGTRSERERFSTPASAPSVFTPAPEAGAYPFERPEIAPNQPGAAATSMTKGADHKLALRALIGDLSLIEKNGVQTALGPITAQMLFEMLAEEVEEDGGSGRDAFHIFEVAKAYSALVAFRAAEDSEDDGPSGAMVLPASITQMGADTKDAGADTMPSLDALHPANRRYYRHADREHAHAALQAAHDAIAALHPGVCKLMTKAAEAEPAPVGPTEEEIAARVAEAVEKAVTAATEPLNDAIQQITTERDALQKRLDEEPDPHAISPIRMVLREQGIPEAAKAGDGRSSPTAAEYLSKAADAQTLHQRLSYMKLALQAQEPKP